LVQRLQAARRDLRLPQRLAKLDRFDLIILDDLSYVRRDQAETAVLFELISKRHERKSIAIMPMRPSRSGVMSSSIRRRPWRQSIGSFTMRRSSR
jgi:DNA replication protein DnaC